MALFHDLQADLLNGSASIGPALLKVRFLASRIGSAALEEWVKHEANGYSQDADVPNYRVIGVSYRATFSGPFGSGISNAPIPPALVAKYAGEQWVRYQVRQSIASIDKLLQNDENTTLQIECSNLIMLLQGKIYEDFACNSVTGLVSTAQIAEIQNSVRSRLLELTLALENEFPVITSIEVGSVDKRLNDSDIGRISYVSQQIIYGNSTSISNSGDGNTFSLNISSGDSASVVRELTSKGIGESDAQEFAGILASETPLSAAEPFGAKAREWIARNIGKAATGAWKAGVAVATAVLTEAALKFYALK